MAITAINLLVGLHTRTSLRVIPRKFYIMVTSCAGL
jgi:hypothetical protein